MIKREMENHGSKSAISSDIAVKEQRVEGSQHISLSKLKIMCFRCTLMSFERNYQTKNLSKQILQSRQLSSSKSLAIFSRTLALQSPAAVNNPKLVSSLNPWFITGFVDA